MSRLRCLLEIVSVRLHSRWWGRTYVAVVATEGARVCVSALGSAGAGAGSGGAVSAGGGGAGSACSAV